LFERLTEKDARTSEKFLDGVIGTFFNKV